MKEIEFTKNLFNSEIVVPDFDVKLGTRGPARFGLYTSRKPMRTTDKNATMNLCALLIHTMATTTWSLKVSSDGTTIVWKPNRRDTIVVKKSKEKKYVVKLPEDKPEFGTIFSTIASLAVTLFDICNDVEFQSATADTWTEYGLESYYLWSDMYYFKYASGIPKNICIVDSTDADITSETDGTVDWFKPLLFADRNDFDGEAWGFSEIEDVLETGKPRRKRKADTSTSTEDTLGLYSKMKAGEYLLNYNWNEDFSSSIKSLSSLDKFVPVPKFFRICQKIKFRMAKIQERLDAGMVGIDAIGNDVININLIGRPGTGKSTLGEALSAVFGMPVGVVKNSDDTDSDEYEGRTVIIDGKPSFTYTDFASIFENGGIILNEEVNLTPSGITMGALGQAVIAPYTLKVNGYKNVQRHPLCIIINLFNVGTVASKTLSQPFIGRFPNTYLLDDPSEEDMINIMMSFGCKGVTKTICKKVYTAYTRTLKYLRGPEINDEDIALAVSMRHCIAACQDIEEGCTLKEALEETIVGVIAAYDLEVANSVRENVIDVLPGI